MKGIEGRVEGSRDEFEEEVVQVLNAVVSHPFSHLHCHQDISWKKNLKEIRITCK